MLLVRSPAPLGLRPSFGFGDRVGLATPGHVDAVRAHGGPIQPVFAQQSMRELDRTGRKATDVMRDTIGALTACSFTGHWSADADHLKTPEDINTAASAGFVSFTIDATELVDPRADQYSPSDVEARYRLLRDDLHWADAYQGQTITLAGERALEFRPADVQRAAVKFGLAIAQGVKMSAHADRVMAKRREAYEIEVTFDETLRPTSPLEHFLIADQCLKSHVKLAALALRWGDGFLPGIEFVGDVGALERDLATHVAIADALGPYKLSFHTGSDKFRLYETIARVTGGRFHIKTAGTSYLEALRVVSRRERKLFRRIVDFARQCFDHDRGPYQVAVKADQLPCAAAIADDGALEQVYLDQPAGRQALHVTYGSVLTDHVLGPCVRDVLAAHPEVYRQLLATHLGRHLESLNRGLDSLAGTLRTPHQRLTATPRLPAPDTLRATPE